MCRQPLAPSGLLVLVVIGTMAPQPSSAQAPAGSHVVPLKSYSRLPTDKRFETVSGDPAKAGEPFVGRIHAEAGYVVIPHTHQVDGDIVVVKGSWALTDARFDPRRDSAR